MRHGVVAGENETCCSRATRLSPRLVALLRRLENHARPDGCVGAAIRPTRRRGPSRGRRRSLRRGRGGLRPEPLPSTALRCPRRRPTSSDKGGPMGFDQYHEPPAELPAATRTFARLCASLTEEAEAIGWYEQRIAIETDPEGVAVMGGAVGEEYKHFSMDLEFLLRRTPPWREIAKGILFQPGDIVEHGEEAEAEALEGGADTGGDGSLGIGGLRGESR